MDYTERLWREGQWQVHAAERYSHCAQVLGVYPEYNHLWDLAKIGFFNIYAMMPPDPMHVIAGIQLHLISVC